jgi:Transposase DDE domain/Transposase domain (DUF772)
VLGRADQQGDLFDDLNRFCEEHLSENSIFAFLHWERDRLFPDSVFADLFHERGRRSVPPSVVATVMVLQRLEGLSDREAVERYMFDTRWRYACGVGRFDGAGWPSFAHTVLVDMRERLRLSERPNRVFEAARDAAKHAGLVGRKRVLDSTALYDAVATMDTVTLIRNAIRGLLQVVGTADLGMRLREALRSGDDYATAEKPHIDWNDRAAREALIDSRARDGYRCLHVLDGLSLDGLALQAAALLATVLGQDLEEGEDGLFRIARRVAKDRVISTVDPEARHGHKTSARGFDGYKGHAAVDPESEIITATTVTPGNTGDDHVAEELIADLLTEDRQPQSEEQGHEEEPVKEPGVPVGHATPYTEDRALPNRPCLYGDNSYGTGRIHALLAEAKIESRCKTRLPTAPHGHFPKTRFAIDLINETVTCPAGVSAVIRPSAGGGGTAHFGHHCGACALRERCTRSRSGRSVGIGPYEAFLAEARERQADPAWVADYRATRPKVERKIAHLMRRKHGGRRARVRGKQKVAADFALLAGSVNLARLATLGVGWTPAGWAQPPAQG